MSLAKQGDSIPSDARIMLTKLVRRWKSITTEEITQMRMKEQRNSMQPQTSRLHIVASMVAERQSALTALSNLAQWSSDIEAAVREEGDVDPFDAPVESSTSVTDKIDKRNREVTAGFQAIHEALKTHSKLLIGLCDNHDKSEAVHLSRLIQTQVSIQMATQENASIKKDKKERDTTKQWRSDVSQHKGLMGMRSFNNERDQFQNWNDRLINNFTQVHVEIREVLKEMNKQWLGSVKEIGDIGLERMFKEEIRKKTFGLSEDEIEEKYKRVKEDLQYILTDKN